MNCEKYEEMIQQFHDGELDKAAEPLIFTHLSECVSCREFLKDLNAISLSIEAETKNFPLSLDEKIFAKIRQSKEINRSGFLFSSHPAIMTYALGAIVILMMFFIFNSEREYKQEMRTAMRQIRYQNEKIDLLINTMPEVHVTSKPGNEIIVHAKM